MIIIVVIIVFIIIIVKVSPLPHPILPTDKAMQFSFEKTNTTEQENTHFLDNMHNPLFLAFLYCTLLCLLRHRGTYFKICVSQILQILVEWWILKESQKKKKLKQTNINTKTKGKHSLFTESDYRMPKHSQTAWSAMRYATGKKEHSITVTAKKTNFCFKYLSGFTLTIKKRVVRESIYDTVMRNKYATNQLFLQ